MSCQVSTASNPSSGYIPGSGPISGPDAMQYSIAIEDLIKVNVGDSIQFTCHVENSTATIQAAFLKATLVGNVISNNMPN